MGESSLLLGETLPWVASNAEGGDPSGEFIYLSLIQSPIKLPDADILYFLYMECLPYTFLVHFFVPFLSFSCFHPRLVKHVSRRRRRRNGEKQKQKVDGWFSSE